jgi:hypothetical protein
MGDDAIMSDAITSNDVIMGNGVIHSHKRSSSHLTNLSICHDITDRILKDMSLEQLPLALNLHTKFYENLFSCSGGMIRM